MNRQSTVLIASAIERGVSFDEAKENESAENPENASVVIDLGNVAIIEL